MTELKTYSAHGKGLPRVTVAGICEPDSLIMIIGVSRCSPLDQFVKSVGFNKALGRAKAKAVKDGKPTKYVVNGTQRMLEIDPNIDIQKQFLNYAASVIVELGGKVKLPRKRNNQTKIEQSTSTVN